MWAATAISIYPFIDATVRWSVCARLARAGEGREELQVDWSWRGSSDGQSYFSYSRLLCNSHGHCKRDDLKEREEKRGSPDILPLHFTSKADKVPFLVLHAESSLETITDLL